MKAFDITYLDMVITINQLENKDFELYHNDELIALLTPKMVSGDLKWFSPHMVAIDAEIIGNLIASKLISVL